MDKKIVTIKQDVSDVHVNFEEGRISGSDMARFQYYKWWGDEPAKGIVIYSHGLIEYGKVFETAAPAFIKYGYMAYALDHQGHGKTPKDDRKKANWESKSMTKCAFNLHALIYKLRNDYPGLPIYVIGYDFGSIVALRMLEKFKTKIDGLVFTGMHPSLSTIKRLRWESTLIRILKANHVPTEHMAHYVNKKYNSHNLFGYNEFDWITSVEENLHKLDKDKNCCFVYKVDFYYFFFKSYLRFYRKKFINKIDKNIPIFIAGGTADSVNKYGRGTMAFFSYLKSYKFKNLKRKMYAESRHNLFLDIAKDNFIYDIVQWIEKVED